MNKVPLRIPVLHYITDYGLEDYWLSVAGFYSAGIASAFNITLRFG